MYDNSIKIRLSNSNYSQDFDSITQAVKKLFKGSIIRKKEIERILKGRLTKPPLIEHPELGKLRVQRI